MYTSDYVLRLLADARAPSPRSLAAPGPDGVAVSKPVRAAEIRNLTDNPREARTR